MSGTNEIAIRQPALAGEVLPPERQTSLTKRLTGKELRAAREGEWNGPRHIRNETDVKNAKPRILDGRPMKTGYRVFGVKGTHVPGLLLIVSAKGAKYYSFRYVRPGRRTATGKGIPNAIGLGSLSLDDARDRAHKLSKMVANGEDPSEVKRKTKAGATTFKQAADKWLELRTPGWRGRFTESHARVLLFTHAAALGDVPVRDIDKALVRKALADVWKTLPGQGRRALARVREVLDFAKGEDMRDGDNPAAWAGCQKGHWPDRPRTGKRRHKAMPYALLPEFMASLRGAGGSGDRGQAAAALEFAVLTAARAGEVIGMRWSEVDFDKAVWTLPETRTKQGREHSVPLSNRAVEILRRQWELTASREYVFTGYDLDEPMHDRRLYTLLRSMGHDLSVHGFRASFRTWAGNETHAAFDVMEISLGHALPGGATVEAYWRNGAMLAKRRELMDEWSRFCGGA